MKELSNEEKAKAYDEKLDVARHIYADPSVKDEDKYYIEVIFPELAESEDERIREKIIATIHLYYGEPLEDEAEEMIAWLEKLCEHKKFRDAIQVGDKVTRNEDGVLVNLSQLNRVAKTADKQGEQKPAWSEEDEMFVHGLIRGLSAKRDIHGHTTFSSDCIDITETINWLNSLKDRVQPQNRWKPSDEQMKVLNTISSKEILSGYERGMLIGLYTELQKLKG